MKPHLKNNIYTSYRRYRRHNSVTIDCETYSRKRRASDVRNIFQHKMVKHLVRLDDVTILQTYGVNITIC